MLDSILAEANLQHVKNFLKEIPKIDRHQRHVVDLAGREQ